MRVYELARQLDIPCREVLDAARFLGLNHVRHQTTDLRHVEIIQLREELKMRGCVSY